MTHRIVVDATAHRSEIARGPESEMVAHLDTICSRWATALVQRTAMTLVVQTNGMMPWKRVYRIEPVQEWPVD